MRYSSGTTNVANVKLTTHWVDRWVWMTSWCAAVQTTLILFPARVRAALSQPAAARAAAPPAVTQPAILASFAPGGEGRSVRIIVD
ncbi:hypothetical protein EVAR_21170_1 [Eumeta japonica]|uniref:Uncharacterized protein n=1 Tax=Eumeta variegata TaxID=151549 RepID=A0A4C1UNM7_EUMVA|nr:hypothetical protein EVAR_21170_1 [Eumeta japonica]